MAPCHIQRMQRFLPTILVLFAVGCSSPADNSADGPDAGADADPVNSADGGAECVGGEIVEVAAVRYCVFVPQEDGVECPDDFPSHIRDSGVVVCSQEELEAGEMDAVLEELGLHCNSSNGSEAECEAELGCEFIPADQQARWVDDACEAATDDLCVLFPNTGNSDIGSCVYREDDAGVDEAFYWGAGTAPPGWQSDFEALPPVCTCLDEFEPEE